MDVVERIENGDVICAAYDIVADGGIIPNLKCTAELIRIAKLGAMVKKEFKDGCPLPKSIDCKKCKLQNLCAVMDCQAPVISKG